MRGLRTEIAVVIAYKIALVDVSISICKPRTKNGNNWERALENTNDLLVHCKVQQSLMICNKRGGG